MKLDTAYPYIFSKNSEFSTAGVMFHVSSQDKGVQ